MLGIYRQWTDEENELFRTREWPKEHPNDPWKQFWGYFLCCNFKQQWTYDDLVKSIEDDLKEDKSFEDLKVKYHN